jgi:hypothetical protein
MLTKTNFLVGEPVNIWCAVSNTTDGSKPLIWASESQHFGVAHDETTWFEGILPLVTPQLRDGIKTKSTGWANEQILYIPPHASVTLLLTYNASLNPKQFKGIVVYDPPGSPGGGYVGGEGLEEARKLCGFSNTFEYEVTDKVEK